MMNVQKWISDFVFFLFIIEFHLVIGHCILTLKKEWYTGFAPFVTPSFRGLSARLL